MDAETKERWKALKSEEAALDQSIQPQINALRATIEQRVAEIHEQIGAIEEEHGETFKCEICGDPFPADEESFVFRDAGSTCGGCGKAWEAEFAACEHDWEPGDSDDGEPGRSCKKCGGFVLDETAAEPVSR